MPITDLPSENLEPLIDIAKHVRETQFGNISLTIRVHAGVIVDIVKQTMERKRYTSSKDKIDKKD